MASIRLEHHYLRLWRLFGSQPVHTTLQGLADQLCCSRRHMRNILNDMMNRGWVLWQSQAGRGHQSLLQLLRSEQQLLSEQAALLIDNGRMGAAFHLLERHQEQLSEFMRARLGLVVQQERQILRVPYFRAISSLYPKQWMRRTEIHLIRQIFNGLTRINEDTEALEGDIAHHWYQKDALTWCFYLRSAVYFHDGNCLQIEDVIRSLSCIKKLPLFSHIEHIYADGHQCVTVCLSRPDPRLPWILAEPAAMILRAEGCEQAHFQKYPVGTGPYRIHEHTQWHLTLTAFDHYFGLRALLDEIDIFILPEMDASQIQALNSGSDLGHGAPDSGSPVPSVHAEASLQQSSALEQGCYFLLFDASSAVLAEPPLLRWLKTVLNPYSLLAEFPLGKRDFWVPAWSVLPGWMHRHPEDACPAPILPMSRLRIAYYEQQPEYRLIAKAIARLLEAHQIAVDIQELRYTDWVLGTAGVDIWLGSMNFSAPTLNSIGAWLFGLPLLRHRLYGMNQTQILALEQAWSEGALSSDMMVRQVIQQGWLFPLFHHWLQLRGPLQIRNLQLNNLGWFDFKSVWLAPDPATS